MAYVHEERIGVRDLDARGRLGSPGVQRVVEGARLGFLAQLAGVEPGRGAPEPEHELGLILAESRVTYRAAVHEGDVVQVRCTVGDLRRSSFRIWFQMRVGDRLAAEGYGVLVGYDDGAGRATALRPDLAERLAAEQDAG
jgi:acyl-CoA thioester hydrolase